MMGSFRKNWVKKSTFNKKNCHKCMTLSMKRSMNKMKYYSYKKVLITQIGHLTYGGGHFSSHLRDFFYCLILVTFLGKNSWILFNQNSQIILKYFIENVPNSLFWVKIPELSLIKIPLNTLVKMSKTHSTIKFLVLLPLGKNTQITWFFGKNSRIPF